MIGRLNSRLVGRAILGSLSALLVCSGSFAQDKYPSRPVEMVVPWGPGGGADQTGRKIAKILEQQNKITVPVVNAPGATGVTGLTKVANGANDGYTVAILTADSFPLLLGSSPKWKLEDFTPIAIMIQQPSGIYVAENSRFATWSDLEREAKARPGQLKVAVSGLGSTDDITIGYLASKGVKMVSVPYAKPGERYSALLGGHVDAMYSPVGNIQSYVDGKQMRPLLLLSNERVGQFKDIPTSVELGYNVTLPQFRGVIVKAGTDPAKVKMLSDMLAKVAADAEYQEFLAKATAKGDSFLPHDAALTFMRGELEAMQSLIATTRAAQK